MNSKLPRFVLVLLAVFCLLLINSCSWQPVYRPWVYADLRLLDPLDGSTPATDILAVYTRTTDLSVDIRVDLLDINPSDKYTLELSFWDIGDFYRDPLTIEISSSGAVHTTGIGNGKPVIWPRVIQDFGLDTITISLNQAFIGGRYHFDVSTFTTDPVSLADEVRDIRSDAQPPVTRAPLLLAFWDDFPATTPAQALRRWDGAHTGPLGGRHGLKHILDSAVQYNLPVVLLDIKNPASLAVLNFMGHLSQLQSLDKRGLLILPDVAYNEPADMALDFSQRAATGFGLPISQFVYAASSSDTLASWGQSLIPGYRAQFLSLTDRSHLAYSGGTRLIPLPAANEVEATEDGPSLEVRQALVKTALSSDPADLAVLGGSLPDSTWGDSDMAYPTFEWIASHPWIEPLDGDSLLVFPVGERYTVPEPNLPESSPWLAALRSAPENAITESAWQTYLTLAASATDTQLRALQEKYLGQVGELLAAARWAEAPLSRIDCAEDLDADGESECILANQNYFAILDPSGARLTNFFYLDDTGPHQLVGPSNQFTVGLSDPSEWRLDSGEAADPSVIPGAFADAADTWVQYTPSITADGILFTSPDGSRVKTFRLTEDGIEVRYQVSGLVSTRVPLMVDPLAFYFGPSNYRPSLTPHAWTWSLLNGISVQVRTDAALSAQGFTSAVPFLSMPEDPNLGYPKGDYFPFPLSVVAIQGNGDFSVQIIAR
ncbi:MAG: hypothetical protein ABIF04_04875 [Chloroflexota bacterium]